MRLANISQEQQVVELETNLEAWCNKLLEMNFEVRHYFPEAPYA